MAKLLLVALLGLISAGVAFLWTDRAIIGAFLGVTTAAAAGILAFTKDILDLWSKYWLARNARTVAELHDSRIVRPTDLEVQRFGTRHRRELLAKE